MSLTCPSCGYSPIGPYIDNCPICAAPVRGDPDCDGRDASSGGWPANLSPLLVGGWIAIGIVFIYLMGSDIRWAFLVGAICGAAWWAVVRTDTLLKRLLAGSLLALFVPGIVLATQLHVLPGLDRRVNTPERAIHEMIAIAQGDSPEARQMSARMQAISFVVLATYAILVPLAFVVPPLLSGRQRRKLGGPIPLSDSQAVAGLAAWILLVPAIGWLAWPKMQAWTEPPNHQFLFQMPPMQQFDPGPDPEEK